MRYPNIAAERARKGLSVEALGKALGVSRRTVWRWETQGKIPQKAIEQMADLFSCSVDYLLEEMK